MLDDSQIRRDALLEALRDGLHTLDDFRQVPHNDLRILRLKRHLREQITALEIESPDGSRRGYFTRS
jgi:hypothetical protein